MSTIITVIFVLVVIGVVLYLINRVVPMDGNIKMVLNVAVVLLTIAWLLYRFGLIDWGGVK